jgi:fluoride ion exporter CrcB/FEX
MNDALAATLWVAIGGAIGSVARYWMGVGVSRASPAMHFPRARSLSTSSAHS